MMDTRRIRSKRSRAYSRRADAGARLDVSLEESWEDLVREAMASGVSKEAFLQRLHKFGAGRRS